MRAFINRSFQAYAYSIRSPIWREGIFQKKTFIRYFHPEQSNKDNSTISMSSLYNEQYNRPAYIDKTLLIERLFEIPEHALITAPKRFGKSLNMDMAIKFFEIEVDDKGKPIVLHKDKDTRYLSDKQSSSKNFKLFEGKKIFKNKEFASKHFGQYPILYVDFKDVSGDNFQEVLSDIGEAIWISFKKHSYLENSSIWGTTFAKETFIEYSNSKLYKSLDKSDLLKGLNFLSACLHAHFKKKVYVFIDEFDAPVSSMIYNKEMTDQDKNKTIDFIRKIISKLVKSNNFVQRSLLTACHHVAGVLSQGANNIMHYPFMRNDYICEFYGLTETEVEHLLKLDKRIPEKLYPQIHEWYNGYKKTLENGSTINIYSPYGIVNYLHQPGELKNYWVDNTPQEVLSAMTHHSFVQKILDCVESPEPFKIKYVEKLQISHITNLCNIIHKSEITDTDFDLYMQFLYENGYFNPVILDAQAQEITLQIPNETIRRVIRNHIYTPDFIIKYYNYNPQKINHFKESLNTLAKSCTRSDIIILVKSIEELLLSGKAPGNEFEVHSVLYVFANQKFRHTYAEFRTPLNKRCDIYIGANIGGNNYTVFVIEIKYERDDCNRAYQQIIHKKDNSLSETNTTRKMLDNNEIVIKNKIYLGIHVSAKCKVTITFSFDDKDLKDLKDSNKNISSNSQ